LISFFLIKFLQKIFRIQEKIYLFFLESLQKQGFCISESVKNMRKVQNSFGEFSQNNENEKVSILNKNTYNAYDFLRDTYDSSDGFSSDSSDSEYNFNICEWNKTPEIPESENQGNLYFSQEIPNFPEDCDLKNNVNEDLSTKEKDKSVKIRNTFHKEDSSKKSEYYEKINIIASKVLKSEPRKSQSYCCNYCNTKNEVNFRSGRYSECKACESKKQIYRRNLRLRRTGDSTKNLSEESPILLCSNCFEVNKVCELCKKIQAHVNARALHKIQEYLCLSCGTNISERFEKGYYSRCRGCKNDYQVQKYKEAKLRSKELKEQLLSPQELERLRVAKTIPSRVESLEVQVQTLSSELTFLKVELEEVKMENSSLKETMEDEFSDLKKQIKELKFIIRN